MTQTLFSSLTTPLTPPTTEEDRLSWLRLFRSRRVGATTFHRLLTEHGTAQAALDALPRIASEAGVRDYAAATRASAEHELQLGQRAGARLVCFGEPDYPRHLTEIADAPPVLWALGDLSIGNRSPVAMVGTRRCSSIGERMARHLAAGLGAEGYAIASGMARGIDACAHDAALPTGTVAVLGGGIDVVYPAENARLRDRIAETGLLLSEQPPGLAPQARHFPPRNRIISGLSRGLIVVEAAARSGSLITARNALDQGRDVLAVPGHPFDGRVSGCNMLIRDGATLLRSVEDAIEVLGPVEPDAGRADPPAEPVPAPAEAPRPARQRRAAPHADRAQTSRADGESAHVLSLGRQILSRLSTAPLAEDQLIRDLGQPASAVAPALLDLELDGRVVRHPGGFVSLGTSGPPAARH